MGSGRVGVGDDGVTPYRICPTGFGGCTPPRQRTGPARPGRKLVFSGDTAPIQSVVDAAEGADLLVHEATFCEDQRERARDTEHSTAAEAARIARDAGVKLLALTHLSTRYFGGDVEREACEIFPATVVPRDFDLIEIPFAERGAPELVKSGARKRRDSSAPEGLDRPTGPDGPTSPDRPTS